MKLNIVVSGSPNTGKTTIAQLIKNTLESHGIKTNVNDLEEGYPTHDQKRCLEALAEKELEVNINVVQLRQNHLTI